MTQHGCDSKPFISDSRRAQQALAPSGARDGLRASGIVISPAKTLDFETPATAPRATQPEFLDQSEKLVKGLRKLGPEGLSSLMGISAKLGELNYDRYVDWQRPFTRSNAKPAIQAFRGDVYTGLDADSFTADDFRFAQQHLRILSGLYGILRPLDLMQPYRLEMGTRYAGAGEKDLYAFWSEAITAALNKQLKALKTNTLLNLASNEYFKSVDRKLLKANIIAPAFKDLNRGNYRIISFYAKKARGLMASWVIRNGITDPADLTRFRAEGYRYNRDLSKPNAPVFTRDEVPT